MNSRIAINRYTEHLLVYGYNPVIICVDSVMNGYERASKEIVPAMRLVIAMELREKYNMTESRIAEILGIAQAAVSKYLNGNYSELVGSAASKVDREIVGKFIDNIAKGDSAELRRCICSVCGRMNSFNCAFSSAQK